MNSFAKYPSSSSNYTQSTLGDTFNLSLVVSDSTGTTEARKVIMSEYPLDEMPQNRRFWVFLSPGTSEPIHGKISKIFHAK